MKSFNHSIKILLIIISSFLIGLACDSINGFYGNGTAVTSSQVAAPTFSPAAGTYSSTQTVTISTTTTGSTIWYTTDGSTPSCGTGTSGGSGVTSFTVSVSTSTTINALACQTGYSDSSVASAAYTIGRKTFETAGTYTGNLTGVTGADAICMADGNYPGSGTYKALIVDGTNRIASVTANAGDGQVGWVLQPNTNYYRSDNTTLIMTTDANGIFVFGALTNTFANLGNSYWTGLNANWTSSAIYCTAGTAWLDGTAGSNGGIGTDNVLTSIAIGGTTLACNFGMRLICVEQ